MAIPRSRLVYLLLIALVIVLGLASRAEAARNFIPDFMRAYAGDTLWALMVFLGVGFLFPQLSTWRVAAIALGLAVLIECSQLYHAGWIDALRQTRLGGLILGFGFLWSDLVCYAVGIACGIAVEWRHRFGNQPKSA